MKNMQLIARSGLFDAEENRMAYSYDGIAEILPDEMIISDE